LQLPLIKGNYGIHLRKKQLSNNSAIEVDQQPKKALNKNPVKIDKHPEK